MKTNGLTASSNAKQWKLVEKDNPLAVHGLFSSEQSAKEHLAKVIPEYVQKGFFMDKTLTAESFCVVYE
jgi:hypothetical protein